ncbi:MAG: pilus assembly protein [Actinobacteria bacterium]|nr:pilus assembly protein [Actinomycetota bacterium]MCL6105231.1 pilus assembly protein [Actinomycetota bacterium]
MKYTCRNPHQDSQATGSMTVEVIALMPLMILLIGFIVYLGRLSIAESDVIDAARAAAQAALIQSTPSSAAQAALAEAMNTLSTKGLACTNPQVNTNTNNFVSGGKVTVAVSCTVSTGNLLVPGLPGSRTLSASASDPLELYREIS